jgi:hypothetical protein
MILAHLLVGSNKILVFVRVREGERRRKRRRV